MVDSQPTRHVAPNWLQLSHVQQARAESLFIKNTQNCNIIYQYTMASFLIKVCNDVRLVHGKIDGLQIFL